MTLPADGLAPDRPYLSAALEVPGLPPGVRGWVTTRANGSLGLSSAEPVGEVMARWGVLAAELQTVGLPRVASAHQVHGVRVLSHAGQWSGWVRDWEADGHVTTVSGTALVVTVADCTPVLLAHPGGAVAALHAGWRGTASGILAVGLDRLASLGYPADECLMYLGPAICGRCYEVGPEVLSAVTGRPAAAKGCLDVRAALHEQAWAAGVRHITVAAECTRCGPTPWFSHRGGDSGRQVAIIGRPAP